MSQDEIKLEYDKATAMATAFNKGHGQLEDIATEMQNIATMMEQGALLGSGGAAFVSLIQTKLCPALARFATKFDELEKDVKKAISLMQEADQSSSSKVSSVG